MHVIHLELPISSGRITPLPTVEKEGGGGPRLLGRRHLAFLLIFVNIAASDVVLAKSVAMGNGRRRRPARMCAFPQIISCDLFLSECN